MLCLSPGLMQKLVITREGNVSDIPKFGKIPEAPWRIIRVMAPAPETISRARKYKLVERWKIKKIKKK